MQIESAVVLCVDDNPRSRRLLTSVLQDSGFEVITADNAVEALGLCKSISFDVALVDYQMPGMSGGELAEEIKCLMPDIPVVLLSGRARLPPAALVFVDAHFGSGTTLDELIEKLKTLAQVKPDSTPIQRSQMPWSDST